MSIREFILRWEKYSREQKSSRVIRYRRDTLTPKKVLLPTSVAGVSLAQGLHRYARDHYQEQWRTINTIEKKKYQNAYQAFRRMHIVSQPYIVGDLAVLSDAEATAETMCRHLNLLVEDRYKVNCRTVPMVGFYKKWIKYTRRQI